MSENHSPETILQEALELSNLQDRGIYLDAACGDDEALRSEIESLLAAHFAADAFMDTQVDPSWKEDLKEMSGDQTGTGMFPSIEELEHDFPELEIVELIGQGGMGAVFKARQASLDRFVALKVLPADWNDSGSFRERFEREAKTLAALNHPNIVTIHDFGERMGRFYFTMEFVDGTDLARMIQSGEMTPDLALSLIPQICEAIQFAHDGGVVHRDIKPANILVGRGGRIKVVDFGIAKLGKSLNLDEEPGVLADPQGDLTAPRGVLGTPRYMAPEQATASSEVDHRADLYALGVVFYEMLVGSPPAKGKFRIRPSRKVNVDRRWDEVIMRALEEDPDRRYQNATEIKTAVETVLAEKKKLMPGWIKTAAVLVAVAAGSLLFWPRGDAGQEGPMENSLGMTFVPVPGVNGLVSVWETRVKDYEVFAKETGRSWNVPSFEQTPDHPAVAVSWHDARAFCAWLTTREQKAKRLKMGEIYRLPTDREWSAMAHLAGEEGTDPKDRDLGQSTVYPWGEEALIPDGAGNYPDKTARALYGSAAVTGYNDRFPATAPVGSFRPTKEGLHDLGGNVWEWTSDFISEDDARPVLRGGGWWAGEADDGWKSLLASHRRADVEATEQEEWDVGFRVVLGPEPDEEVRNDLFHLVLKGDLEGVRTAVASGTEVNAANRAGQPPIVLAAESGNLEMVKLLHEHGAKLDGSDRRGRTPLHAAAEIGHTGLAGWLLEQGANSRARTIAGQAPLLLAVRGAPIELLDLLLEAGGPEVLTESDSLKNEPLTLACIASPDETVRWVIDQLSSDQVRGIPAQRLANWAVWLAERDRALMTAFLKKASGSLKPDTLGMAMVAAINYDNEENFSRLAEAAGEDALDEQTMRQLGVHAVGRGRPWAVKALRVKGWDLKVDDDRGGKSILHWALVTGAEMQQGLRSYMTKFGKGQDGKWMVRLLDRQLAKMPPPHTRETIRILAEAGVDLEARDDHQRTPLTTAAMKGNLDAVETLLKLGAEIEAKDDIEFTPLLCAVENGHLEVVKELERRGANIEAVNKYKQGVLHNVHRHAEVLRYLLESKDLEVDAKDQHGATPLGLLAREVDEEVISLFLEAGANVHVTFGVGGEAGTTPLHRACHVNEEDAQQTLDTNAALGGPNLRHMPAADREERVRVIKLLLEAGADPAAKTAAWMTPLHLAAGSGLSEVVELFLEGGAELNGLTKALNSPLQLAALHGRLKCAEVLLEHGALVDHPLWQMPLATTALEGEDPAVLALLLEHKAPLDKRDPYGAYPLHRAAYSGRTEMAEMMLEAGADPDARDFTHQTPVHAAANTNQRESIDLLWKWGGRMNAIDASNHTPAQRAAQAGHIALAKHIEELARNPVDRPKPAQAKPTSQK